jgi:hypothetical protein
MKNEIGFSRNQTSKTLERNIKRNKERLAKKYEGWYNDYVSHPSAQWQMTFAEYKILRRKNKHPV